MRRRGLFNRLLGGSAVRRGGARGAFTLVELIVAVGAVALLTVGVGQVFRSVGSLVSTGSAVAEVEQLARAIEAQMRSDFAALNRMRSDEVFMAIRCRRVGDIDLDGEVATGEQVEGYRLERALYLRAEDREADQKDGLAPYAEGSRAVTRRLDEIMFLGYGGDGGLYHSYTPTCKDNAYDECDACVRDVSADTVRIYYGHGLRPAVDVTEFDVQVDSQGRQWRSYIPDGDFGTPINDTNRYDPARQVNNGISTGRNEYAGDWPLLRQAMLLYGGSAAGERPDSGVDEAIICNDREFSPYIRDTEVMQRFGIMGTNAYRSRNWARVNPLLDGSTRGHDVYNPDDGARPRLAQLGRTDICAQSPEEVQRWLEGWDGVVGSDASAYSRGRYNDPLNISPLGFPAPQYDWPLWAYNSLPVGVNTNLQLLPIDVGIFSSIAGCFARYICETEPPIVNRGDDFSPEDSCDSVMDTSAVIAARCSNFEVAWSDPQSRWRTDNDALIPPPLDPETDKRLNNIKSGDVIWYDYNFSRRLLVPMAEYSAGDLGYTYLDPFPNEGRELDPEILHRAIAAQRDLVGGFLDSQGQYREGKVIDNVSRRFQPHATNPDVLGNGYLGYDWKITGGSLDEYMAVFPYRVPDVGNSGGLSSDPSDDRYLDQAFPKPQFIRIRMTLHDSGMRLKDGKDFEFIFLVDLQ